MPGWNRSFSVHQRIPRFPEIVLYNSITLNFYFLSSLSFFSFNFGDLNHIIRLSMIQISDKRPQFTLTATFHSNFPLFCKSMLLVVITE